MVKLAELDWIEMPTPTVGGAEVLPEDDHGAHTFLYIPDLTERSGYATHRVPEPKGETKGDRRPMGFRR